MAEKVKDTETVKQAVEKFDGVQDAGFDSNDIPVIVVPAEKIFEVCKFLKEERGYDYFNSLTGAEDANYYISIYHIYAILDYTKRRITIKVNSPKDKPEVPSVVEIYPAADWFERESYDLMGIIYKGHPNLTRILTTDDWVGHTCRKDYKIVEPESYTAILKANPDEHVQPGIQRTDIFKGFVK